ncbi:MAG: TetR/AcrR family transcriptional regulator [Chitinophagaceae bacterium]|nr:MAG: TetR/AcrR family transcriptional regulator [Chitinophagaceae bacterium]
MKKSEQTRAGILYKSFALVYANGYQATSIDQIIATTEVTKGAFFYHFKNKDEMGLAMIREVMKPGMYRSWIAPLLISPDPLTSIYEMMEEVLLRNKFFDVRYGCPAMNLAEEMSPVSEVFRDEMKTLMADWQAALEKSVNRAKKSGMLAAGINGRELALFVTSGYAGARVMGKLYGKAAYRPYLNQLKNYLESMR